MNYVNPLEKWLIEKDQQLFEYGKEIVKEQFGIFLSNMAELGMQFLVNILPNVMGFGALLTGGLAIISSMAGKGVGKPMGIYAGLLIVSVSILEVA